MKAKDVVCKKRREGKSGDVLGNRDVGREGKGREREYGVTRDGRQGRKTKGEK